MASRHRSAPPARRDWALFDGRNRGTIRQGARQLVQSFPALRAAPARISTAAGVLREPQQSLAKSDSWELSPDIDFRRIHGRTSVRHNPLGIRDASNVRQIVHATTYRNEFFVCQNPWFHRLSITLLPDLLNCKWGDRLEAIPVIGPEGAEVGLAQAQRFFEHRVEHRS